MQASITIDDELIKRAEALFGPKPIAELVREALHSAVEREAARLLIELGGSDPSAEAPGRRRPDDV